MRWHPLLFVLGLVASTLAQSVTLNSASTECSLDPDASLCTYTLSITVSADFTAAPVGAGNQVICNLPGGGVTAVENPYGSRVFVNSTTPDEVSFDARCDCTSLTWSIEDSSLVWTNTNPDAVLNDCDFCGPAVGNDGCQGDPEDECFGAPVCVAGECVRADKCEASTPCFIKGCLDPSIGCNAETPKCDDRTDDCFAGTCNPTTYECTYNIDLTIAGCVFDAAGEGEIYTQPDTEDVFVQLDTPTTVMGFNSDGEVTFVDSTDSFVVDPDDNEVTTDSSEVEHRTSDAHPDRGGLTNMNISLLMIFGPIGGIVVTSVILVTSLYSLPQ